MRSISSTELNLRDISSLRYVVLKKVNFFVGHPVCHGDIYRATFVLVTIVTFLVQPQCLRSCISAFTDQIRTKLQNLIHGIICYICHL